jgi:cyclic pyranopterin phosphate synthase
MERLMRIFSELGINKLRITGGEPFVRKGIMEFLEKIARIEKIDQINITTNGTFTKDYVKDLERLGVKSVNLSLDSLDRDRFFKITRRDMFDKVMDTFQTLLESSIRLKINMVVMEGRNIEDIASMLELTRENDVAVRFIEEMPFNGSGGNPTFWPMRKILEHIKNIYPDIEKLKDPESSTSVNYKLPGHVGSFGIIAAYTRTFCGTCNRIRITPQGTLKTCLYDNGGLSFRDVLRSGATDDEIAQTLLKAMGKRYKDGFEAENDRGASSPVSESMATIGG